MSVTPLPFVVWYNTHCPVCRTGIDRQRNRLFRAVQAGTIEFRDINLEPGSLASLGIDIEAVRRRLHGMDENGQVYIGIDCALEIWRRTPGEAWIARLLEPACFIKWPSGPTTASLATFMPGTAERATGGLGEIPMLIKNVKDHLVYRLIPLIQTRLRRYRATLALRPEMIGVDSTERNVATATRYAGMT